MSKSAKPEAQIICKKNGPYLARDVPELTGADGEKLPVKKTMALCRCGETKNRPFCDGTHASIGFEDEKKPDRVSDKLDSYEGNTVTIRDNRGACSHAGFCTDGLPAVFRMGVEPWIDTQGADPESIAAVVATCPSGALRVEIGGTERGDRERPPAIRVTPHGPLRIEGGIELEGIDRPEGTSREHATLCRCGQSNNKPFCDGSHWYANFRDDGLFRVAMKGDLEEGKPVSSEVEGVRLVVVKTGDDVHILSGTCLHQGADLADGDVEDGAIVCGLHGWRYALATGQKIDDPKSCLRRFTVTIDPRWGEVLVSLDEIRRFRDEASPSDEPLGTATREEPHNAYIQELAENGLANVGAHGPMAAMGVPRYQLPSWDAIQILTGQLATPPLLDDAPVETGLVIGPRAAKPLALGIPILVSDMSFGSLSREAKVALARGAELAGTGICSGEGGMLPEEQQANSRYLYELASARFGFSIDKLALVQAFHFKGGQAAKTGTGGHLPGEKVTAEIAAVRGLEPGTAAVSPSRFPDWDSLDDYRRFADQVREKTGGIPIGFKLSAQHIEADLAAALKIGVDYIILDGRGGGTGAAPLLFRDNISVPTIPALARARRFLDEQGRDDVTLIITGGLRTPADFVKALALGADGIAIANSAIQAIGCLGTRACHTNNCPAGIATQKEHLRKRLDIDQAAANLDRFLRAAVSLMTILARACAHASLSKFTPRDLTTFDREIAHLSGIPYAGVGPLPQ